MSDAHHDNHNPHLAHHFDTPQQQFDTAKMGMWVFLATEILMFGGLFCAYAIYRGNHPEVFEFAHQALDTKWGAINTVVLLLSSFTMAWGVRAAQLGQKSLLVILLALTLLGGVGFMVIKTIEYAGKWKHVSYDSPDAWYSLFIGERNAFYQKGGTLVNPEQAKAAKEYVGGHHGSDHDADHAEDQHTPDAPDTAVPTLVPVAAYAMPPAIDRATARPAPIGSLGTAPAYTGEYAAPVLERQLGIPENPGHSYPGFDELHAQDKSRVHIFFQIYFLMTGLHGIHVVIGMGLIFWIMVRAAFGAFGPSYYTPVDLVGLYWHLVDLIWIFLFPLLYLIH